LFSGAARRRHAGAGRAVNKTQAGFCVNGFVAKRKGRGITAPGAGRARPCLKMELVSDAENC
jgi:hypothetical protein